MEEQVKEFVEERAMIEHGQKLEVLHLWDGRYRANVWEFDPKCFITQSFFIKTDGEEIVFSDPYLGEPEPEEEESEECQMLEL